METQSVETKNNLRKPSGIGEEIRKELERRGFRAPKPTAKDDQDTEQTQPLDPEKSVEVGERAPELPEPTTEAVQTSVDTEELKGEGLQEQSFDLPDTSELQLMSGAVQHVDVAQDEAPTSDGQVEVEYEEAVQVYVAGQGNSLGDLEDLPVTAELDQEVLRVLDAIQSVSEGSAARGSSATSEIAQTFLSRASHELRTPLQTINGFLELLFSGKMTDTQQVEQFVKLSYREGSYLADRIADLELASQIEAGSLRISPVLLSMEQMIADGIQAFEPFTWDRALHFEKPENSEVPSLYGDYALLKQALRNLIGIALKLSPAETDVYVQAQENQGELSIRISNESAESGKANSEVVDLEPRDFSDESIGVFVARKILQAHGGGLSTYRSEDGQIIFQINVPLEAPAKRRGTILITEDNAQAAALLEIALEKEGYTPIRATNGLEALEIIANDSVDLVLLDVILPGMDGYEVCYRMRSSPESASIPVVIVSAKSGDEDEAKALRVGADAYLRKPLQLAQLLVAIEELLEDGSGGVGKRQIQSLSPTQPLN